MYLIYIVKQIH